MRVGPTTLFYQHNPIDVEGWRGDNFAFTFNIADYNVITSDSVHLPPTVHLFMQATGVCVMNFLPKPAEGVPGTERTPWYHRNVDYDEIAFFHGGSLYGIPMPPGLISHAPQGVHLGFITVHPNVPGNGPGASSPNIPASTGRSSPSTPAGA